ncbi:MAG: InlB B-repeat-containing protein [Alphaproteobacteria bacterium]
MSIILISAPAFSYVTNSSQCDNDVLSTYSGSANLTANWTGNTINVTWYNDDTQYANNSCTYGGNLTMPSSIPTKTGYTFKGWRVKPAQCSLSGLDPSIDTSWDATHARWKRIHPNGISMLAEFGTENSSDLNDGEWAVTFSYGTVKGMAKCSDTKGIKVTPGTPSDTSGKYCWCQATNYTPNGGNQCNVASPSWVFLAGNVSGGACVNYCASNCAGTVVGNCADGNLNCANLRRALFGVAQ